MKKILVAYKSHYGSTKQYAEWIAEALGADLKERREVTPAMLMEYDLVIYGGGLYAGGIIGAELVAKNPCRSLILFTVGAADPDAVDFTEYVEKYFPAGAEQPQKVFHLRGDLDYSKMSFVHRSMMKLMKKMTVDKKRPEDWSPQDRFVAETYGGKAEFVNRAAAMPIVDYARALPEDGGK
jgi:menaquinone-dependent protoporphyrinogen IX oxidase